ncbi:multidrug effflux MFS transporter [Actinocorallia libanotica]|uniref:multidrug effflux MFS transporter n=1 Tax=Actinocorallia libanotica TaxID=46162 RepID=UPI0031E0D914
MTSASPPPPTATAPPARTTGLIVVLGALTAIAPLTTDMYIPALPSMGEALDAGSSSIQLTLTSFLAGLILGQVVAGPVSDGLGRRGLLIGGMIGFAVTSLLCAVAPDAETLIAVRFLQGATGAVGMVLARAIITDRFHGRDIPRYFAILSQILGVAPVVAPVIGGGILAVSTWRAVFFALTLVGVLLLVSVLLKVPETLPPERRRKDGLAGTFRAMGRLACDRAFLGYALVMACASASLFAYISGSSFVFQNLHGTSSTVYSLIFASNAVGMLVAGALFGRLSSRRPVNLLLTAATVLSLLGAAAQAAITAAAGETLAGTWITLFLAVGGIGMLFPAAMTLGQTLGRAAPGAASALMGGLQFLFGALVSPLVGLFGESSSLPMALIMLASMLLAALALLTLARPWLRQGEVTAGGH